MLLSPVSPSASLPVETRHSISLPLTTLSYAVCGEGEPLIMVPATISLIDDWLPYLHFVGQDYRAHFFELPGHGGSTAFEQPYSSDLVAETIEQFADALGFDRFAVMGFSFGGLLAMKTLQRMGERVSKVIMLSPYVSRRGLMHSPPKLQAVRAAAASAQHPLGRETWLRIINDPTAVRALAWFMTTVGKYETTADLQARLLGFSDSSFDTLIRQIVEILSCTEEELAGPYSQPCFFGMSQHDPLLDYQRSLRFARSQFADLRTETWDFPFHAPRVPFTFEQLNREYGVLLSAFDR